jgi:hypothetical protein
MAAAIIIIIVIIIVAVVSSLRCSLAEDGRTPGGNDVVSATGRHSRAVLLVRASSDRFSFGSSRFNVQTSAQNGATTQFESQRNDIYSPEQV